MTRHTRTQPEGRIETAAASDNGYEGTALDESPAGGAELQAEEGQSDEVSLEDSRELGTTREPEQPDETVQFLKGLVEALVFVSDHPIELKELARAAKIDKKRAGELLELLSSEYAGRGIRLDEVGGGVAFRSDPKYADYVRSYLALRPVRLSRPQLETLAIVAYRQPITRPEVDEIRGVDAGPVLKGLLERDLIRIIGKKDEPGRPMLYGTTQTFLQVFSLKSLRDLPTLREFTELNDDSRRVFEREIGEEPPELGLVGESLGGEPEVSAAEAEGAPEPVTAAELDAASSDQEPRQAMPDDDDDEEDEDDEDDDDEDGEDEEEEGDDLDDDEDDDDDDEEDEEDEDDED